MFILIALAFIKLESDSSPQLVGRSVRESCGRWDGPEGVWFGGHTGVQLGWRAGGVGGVGWVMGAEWGEGSFISLNANHIAGGPLGPLLPPPLLLALRVDCGSVAGGTARGIVRTRPLAP